jgi:hypothetical protein
MIFCILCLYGMLCLCFFWNAPISTQMEHHNVILKIRPFSHFQDGYHMSIHRNSDIPSKKRGFGGKLYLPRSYTGLFLLANLYDHD